MVALARAAGGDATAWRALRDDFVALRHVLIVHDAAETALLARARGAFVAGGS